MRSAPILAAAILAASLLTVSSAAAAVGDAKRLGPLYVEPAAAADAARPSTAGGCAVQIELTDPRRDPQIVGSFGVALRAPDDREAWLRSVFDVGLKARGFTPSFAPAGGPLDPALVTARIRMHVIWIGAQQMNKVGSVALRGVLAAPGAPAGPEMVYRGDKTGLNMWGSTKEFNDHANAVFALALDDLAEDLRALCAAPPTTSAALARAPVQS
ncbi:MAG TPA: hypothetical protein PLF78_09550 [Caulobacter sp.]|nr:hypothetical protein [Caulobacter sp.]